jgi:urea carboxylase-associated protein 2
MSTSFQHEETPDFYRRRYEELKARAVHANARRVPAALARNPEVLAEAMVLERDEIPGGWYWTARLARGQSLRIVNSQGTPGVSVTLWNADDPSERFNHGDTVKLQWTVRLGRGKLLMSDMGRVLAAITDESDALHDPVLGGSTPQSNARKYGDASLRNAQENFALAAGKHGLSARDIGSVINFFAPIVTDEAGNFSWQEGGIRAGDRVDLRAEMNLIVAVSNTPHPLSPGVTYRAEPVQVVRWRSAAPAADDFCRGATQEAVRAFENTAAYFRE